MPDCDQILDALIGPRTDTRDIDNIFCIDKGAVLIPIFDDLLRRGWTNARKSVQFGSGGCVDVDQFCRCGDDFRERRADDRRCPFDEGDIQFFAILKQLSKIYVRLLRLGKKTTGSRNAILNARPCGSAYTPGRGTAPVM